MISLCQEKQKIPWCMMNIYLINFVYTKIYLIPSILFETNKKLYHSSLLKIIFHVYLKAQNDYQKMLTGLEYRNRYLRVYIKNQKKNLKKKKKTISKVFHVTILHDNNCILDGKIRKILFYLGIYLDILDMFSEIRRWGFDFLLHQGKQEKLLFLIFYFGFRFNLHSPSLPYKFYVFQK